jgi:hypothetical protein
VNKFFLQVLATVLGAAIVADTALLFQFNARLARIETKLEFMPGGKVAAKNE